MKMGDTAVTILCRYAEEMEKNGLVGQFM